jgi:pimeloyl-ACP methyl ester carboxylesterase
MGVARQYAAILAQPRWHERLSGLDVPTLVLHGEMDTLILPAAGQDIARRVPGTKIDIIGKWGHDLPEAVMPVLLNRIVPFLGQTAPSGPA